MASPIQVQVEILAFERVRMLLLAAYDLLEAAENADAALITDEIAEKARDFRAVIEGR